MLVASNEDSLWWSSNANYDVAHHWKIHLSENRMCLKKIILFFMLKNHRQYL